MNTATPETTKENWSELKGKIKARFSKLSDDSIESAKGNLEMLTDKLQDAYGYAKEQASKELAGFKSSLHVTPSASPKAKTDVQ